MKLNSFNHILCVLGLFFLASACGKNKLNADIIDLSITNPIEILNLKKIGSQFILVGGDRYNSAAIMVLNDQGQLHVEPLPTNSSQKAIYGIDISASGRLIAVGYGGSIYHCAQLGQPWTFIQDNSWREFQDVSFTNNDSAVIVGGIVFKDGWSIKCNEHGLSHEVLRQDHPFEICDVDFVTLTHGYLCGYGAVMRTENAGQSWTYTTAQNDFFKAMSWKNEREGLAVGYEGSILKTSDGGTTWSSKRSGNNFWKTKWRLLNVAFNGNDTYAAVGESGCVVVSRDDGETWTEINTSVKADLKGVEFEDQKTFLATGTKGTILKIRLL